MKIEVENTYSRIVDATDAEVRWVDRLLSFPDVRALRMPVGDGRVHMLSPLGRKFLTGLLPDLRTEAAAAGLQVDVESHRVAPCRPNRDADLSWLRPDQLDPVHKFWDVTRGIVWEPTAAGKTEIFIGAVLSIPCPWLFLVHRFQLAVQTAERLKKRTGLTAGLIGDGQWSEGERLTCATFQSLVAALKRGDRRAIDLCRRIRGLGVDEAHTLPADTFLRTAATLDGAYWRMLLSATPLARGDFKSPLAVGIGGPPFVRSRPKELADQGIISRPTIRMVKVTQEGFDGVPWLAVRSELLVRSDRRNRALEAILVKCAKPALCFVDILEHGHVLTRLAERVGLRAQWVEGKSSLRAREEAGKRLMRGELDLVVSTTVMQEGVDLPRLAAVVNAAGGRSEIATIQRLGRGARRADGKDGFEMWDVLDVGHEWLARHARMRKEAYEREWETTVEILDPDAVAGQADLFQGLQSPPK